MMLSVQLTFHTCSCALSLSKGLQGFDKLGPNGVLHG